jgi:hypothetical protein
LIGEWWILGSGAKNMITNTLRKNAIMSNKENRDPVKELDAVYDALADSIANAKDDELLEEATLHGQDAKSISSDVKSVLLKSLT